MYLKKMLFAVVGVAMLFSGIFPAAAQEQKTETQVNTNLASEQLNVISEETDSMEEEAMEFNVDDGTEIFLLWGGEGTAAECTKIFLLNADTDSLEEITSKYVKFDKIPIIQSGHYYIFGLRNGIVEDLKKDMIYETHDPIKNS